MMSRIGRVSVAAILLGCAGAVFAQTVAPSQPPPSKPVLYWLGIGVFPLPSPLRVQLGLPEKQGLLVQVVAPNSPAAKAGIARYDVLLRIGEQPLSEPRDLIDAVAASGGKRLKINLIHGGKSATLDVSPAVRPKEIQHPAAIPEPGDWQTMERWMENLWSEQPPPLRFRILHPGAIVPKEVFMTPSLPEGLSITISKQGNQPAKIIVQRDGRQLEVTEKELDRLPADLRPHVERMLGRSLEGVVNPLAPQTAAPGAPTQEPATWSDRIEQRMNEMTERLDQIFHEMHELREEQTTSKSVEK
ncbi:MAG: PDZ domain-containing protein [Planctomycetaceae bacterium]|nr:PDZ domain-containing protein [Planctomycetaceae bacterium]